MKFFSTIASTIACAALVHSAALAQGPEEPATSCTFTVSTCPPLIGPTETITVYEQPFTSTATLSVDCQGCQDVTTVVPRYCGLGPQILTTTFVYENAQATTTVDVCSPTPN